MLRSDLHLDLTVPDRLPWWLRLIPEALLLSLWRRSVSAALERMQARRSPRYRRDMSRDGTSRMRTRARVRSEPRASRHARSA